MTSGYFGGTWREVLEALRRAMLEKNTTVDVARKAGIKLAPSSSDAGNARSLSATVDPTRGTVTSGSSATQLTIVCRRLVHNSGFGFDPVPAPHSFKVPVDGVYRIDFSAGVWRESRAWHDREYLALSYAYSNGAFYRQVSLARDYAYPSTSFPIGKPAVYRGTTWDLLQAGMMVQFAVGRNWDFLPGAPVDIYNYAEPEYTRFTARLVTETTFS